MKAVTTALYKNVINDLILDYFVLIFLLDLKQEDVWVVVSSNLKSEQRPCIEKGLSGGSDEGGRIVWHQFDESTLTREDREKIRKYNFHCRSNMRSIKLL